MHMHTIEIPQKNKTITFPQEIAEMNKAQYIAFSELAYQFTNQFISFGEFKVRLTYKLVNLKRKVDMNRSTDQTEKIANNIYCIAQLMESFFETKTEKGKKYKIIKLDHIGNLIPYVTVRGKKWYGPKDALLDCTFGQYIQATHALCDYNKTKDENQLNLLVAILYKPKKEKYDPNTIEERAAECATIPIGERYGIQLFFAACQEWIVTNKELSIGGGNSVDLTVLFKSGTDKEASPTNGIGMLSALYSLAETTVFGDIEKTSTQHIYDVLIYMVQKHTEAVKLKKDATHRRPKNLSGSSQE